MSNVGRNSTLGFAEEVTWGTPLARTNWLRQVSESLDRVIDRPDRPHLGDFGSASANRRSRFQAMDNVGGDITTELAYDDTTLMLLKHALGQVVTSGAGPFVHTFKNIEALTEGLTIERIRGFGDAAEETNVFEGMLVDSFALTQNIAEVAQQRYTFIGETEAGRVAAGTPVLNTTFTPVLHLHADATPLTWDGNQFDVLSWELLGTKNLVRRQQVGSDLTQKPTRGNFEELLLRITREYKGKEFYDGFVAQTPSDVVLDYTGPGNFTMKITGHNAEIVSAPSPVSGPGIVTETVEFRLFADAVDGGLEIVINNDSASALTN